VERIFDMIKSIEPRLGAEVGDSDGIRTVIFSANGFKSLFPLVEKLVQVAPSVEGWHFIALKPPRGFDFTFRFSDGEVEPDGWMFLPMRDASGALAIQVCMNGEDNIDEEIVRVVIETGVGERLFGELADCFVATQQDVRNSDRWLPISVLIPFLERTAKKGSGLN